MNTPNINKKGSFTHTYTLVDDFGKIIMTHDAISDDEAMAYFSFFAKQRGYKWFNNWTNSTTFPVEAVLKQKIENSKPK